MQTRVIDNTVIYESVTDDKRKQVQSDLMHDRNQAYLTGATGLSGFAYSAYQFMNGYSKSGITGGIFSLSLAALGFTRGLEASDESLKWEDKTQAICQIRKTASNDFNQLMDNDMRTMYFTKAETQHIWFKTNDKLKKAFEMSMDSDDLGVKVKAIDTFIAKDVINRRALRYAFKQEDTISNPKKQGTKYWERKDLESIAILSKTTKERHTLFNTQTKQAVKSMQEIHSVAEAGVNVVKELSNTWSEKDMKMALSPYLKERDDKLKDLEQNKNQLGHLYEARKFALMNEHDNRPEVKEIKARAIKEENNARLMSEGAKTALHLYTHNQKALYLFNRQSEQVNEFSILIDEELRAFETTRKDASRF